MCLKNLRLTLFCAFISVFMLFVQGCKESGTTDPESGTSMIGNNHLYSVTGIKSGENGDVLVSVFYRDASGAVQLFDSVQTSADGRWVLAGPPLRTYTFVFSRPGYGTRKVFNLIYKGGHLYLPTYALYKIPDYTVSELAAVTAAGKITMTGNLTGTLPDTTRNIRLFVDTTANVSGSPQNYIYTTPVAVKKPAEKFTLNITSSSLKISKGKTVYIAAFADSFSPSNYTDSTSKREVYPNLNPARSNVVTVIVP